MFEKCGYKTEGVLRQSIYKNGKFQNQVIMSILQEDFYQMLKDRGIE
jgi:RimJ/RimL family protein N-acetyltransferase